MDQIKKTINFRIADDKAGITAPEAHLKYGNKLLKLFEAYPLFENRWQQDLGLPKMKRKSKSREDIESLFPLPEAITTMLENERPFWTGTVTALSRLPLGEAIQKDGKDSFLADASDGFVWRLQIPEKFLTLENLRSFGMLFIVENGVSTEKSGNEYTSYVGRANDMRMDSIIEGWTITTNRPLLFGESGERIESLNVYLKFPSDKVKVGLVSVGDCYDVRYDPDVRNLIRLPGSSSDQLAVLLESTIDLSLLAKAEQELRDKTTNLPSTRKLLEEIREKI